MMRQVLKAATRSEHERLDAAFSACRLDERGGYVAVLGALAPPVTALEAALARAGIEATVPDWERRRRGEALRADLARLGGSFRRIAPPPVATPEEGLAVLYVLEGSRLGARLLLERVLASPDSALHAATGFLRHGQDERLWPSFLSLLEGRSYSPRARGRMVEAARATFALFERCAHRAAAAAAADEAGIGAPVPEAAARARLASGNPASERLVCESEGVA